ncbi:uncharacterized protein [Temnothorax longispinosus]|uniref:uncharacterized protein n=1 Tax=Temnothorax longispinosus TaxID=300112 RepID=UPI003A991E5F
MCSNRVLCRHAKTGNRGDKSNRSVFRVPKDVERLRQWVAAIPGIVKLKPTHVICDKHFEDQHIIREWIKRDGSGRIIAQAPYKYPQLSKLAVPTKLLHDVTNNEAVDSLAESSSHLVSSVINSVDTPHVQDVSYIQLPISEDGQSLTAMEEADTIMIPTSDPHTEISSAQVNISSTSIIDTPYVQDVSYIQLPNISEDGQSLIAMEEADTIMIPPSDPHTEISSAPLSKLQTQDKLFLHLFTFFTFIYFLPHPPH